MTSPQQAANVISPNSSSRRRWLSRRTIVFVVVLVVVSLGVNSWNGLVERLRLRQAQAHLSSRQPELAIESLNLALRRNPQNPETHYLLAKAYRRLGELTLVRDHLSRALRLGFDRLAVQREQWLALAQTGQMREARPHLSELLVQQVEDARNVCEAFVNGFFLTNQFGEAFRLLDLWQTDFPNDSQPYLFRGQFYESRTNFKEAESAYREGLQREPRRNDLMVRQARCLLMLREYDESRRLVEQVLTAKQEHAEAQEILAQCYFEQGQTEECRKLTEQLVSRQPKLFSLRTLMARVQLQDRRYDEALQVLIALADERPHDLTVRYLLATTLQATGDSAKAAEAFQFVAAGREAVTRALKLQATVENQEPRNVGLRLELGEILLKYESPEAGAGWMRSVLEIEPNHQRAHQELAKYYRRIGALEQAQQHEAQVRTIEP